MGVNKTVHKSSSMDGWNKGKTNTQRSANGNTQV